jgi:hypothetical protein
MEDANTRSEASGTYFKSKRQKTGIKTENVDIYSRVERLLSTAYT